MAFTSTTPEVTEHFQVTRNTLSRLRTADILQPGVHFVAAGGGIKRPNLRWDLDAIEKTFQRRSRKLQAPKPN